MIYSKCGIIRNHVAAIKDEDSLQMGDEAGGTGHCNMCG